MDALFWTRVGLSFTVASTVVAVASVLAERYGPRIGGIIATLPTTIVVNTLFMSWIHDPVFTSGAMVQTVVMMGANSVFLALYVLAIPLGWWRAGLVALGGWAAIAAVLLNFPSPFIWVSVALFTLLTVASFLWLDRKVAADTVAVKTRNTPLQIAARGLLAGAVVANAQILANALGPVWGGIFVPAPAIFLSTMWIFHRTQGGAFAGSVARSMCLAGFIPMIYATVVSLSFPTLGIWWGSLLAFALSLPVASAVSGGLKWFQKRGSKRAAVQREAESPPPVLTR